jgi:PKD repeat protein
MEEIEFDNYSIGDIIEYQWDFNNDGTIDSYDEFPIFTYQDTGYYSVSLTVVGQDSSNTFLRENYVHVIDTSTIIIENNKELSKVIYYPNPFSDNLIIKVSNNNYNQIEIYNNMGEMIKMISSGSNTITWEGNNDKGQKCLPGIYYIKVNNSANKVILTK